LQTTNRRVIAVSPTIEEGNFYSGDRRKVALDVTVRARPGVIVYLSGEWNRIQLAEGRFETRLFRVVPELQFSPWLSLVNNIQYDSVSAELGCVHSELAARSAPQSLLDARSTGCVEAALHPAVLRRTLNTIGQRVVFL